VVRPNGDMTLTSLTADEPTNACTVAALAVTAAAMQTWRFFFPMAPGLTPPESFSFASLNPVATSPTGSRTVASVLPLWQLVRQRGAVPDGWSEMALAET
jgi:hypothetical protein